MSALILWNLIHIAILTNYIILSLGGRNELSCEVHCSFLWKQSLYCSSVRLVHFVLEIHTMFMSTLVIFSPTFPRWSVKVSLLPSNTLSGTIWSWMMSIACMTTGKSISLKPFCPQSSNKGNHTNLIWARLGAPSDKIQHVSHHWCRAKWNEWHIGRIVITELAPLRMCTFMRCRPHSAVLCWLWRVVIVMNACHLIFRTNGFWRYLARFADHTTAFLSRFRRRIAL